MKRLLITAGPTREKIDPVRFLSNYSTGTFGYEVAKAALRRGCRVTLISGPTCLRAPSGLKLIKVESAVEMRDAVKREVKKSSYLIMAAAVSDWRVRRQARNKIKRHNGKKALELVENPDILSEIGKNKGRLVSVGFALETEELVKNAFKKLKEKNLDLIIANRLSQKKSVFGDNVLDALIIDKFGNKIAVRRKSKRELAKIVLDNILNFNI